MIDDEYDFNITEDRLNNIRARECCLGCGLIITFSILYLIVLLVLKNLNMLVLNVAECVLVFFGIVVLIICVIRIRVCFYNLIVIRDMHNNNEVEIISYRRNRGNRRNREELITIEDVENALVKKYRIGNSDNIKDLESGESSESSTDSKDVCIKKGELLENECVICLNEMKEHILLNCNHKFHMNCLATWLMNNRNKTCPLCRIPDIIVKEDIVKRR